MSAQKNTVFDQDPCRQHQLQFYECVSEKGSKEFCQEFVEQYKTCRLDHPTVISRNIYNQLLMYCIREENVQPKKVEQTKLYSKNHTFTEYWIKFYIVFRK